MKQATTSKSGVDRAYDTFTEMMIKQITEIDKDWRKPWFTEGLKGWPTNLSGREYNGTNALFLLLHCDNQGYEYPVFGTFKSFKDLTEGEPDEERRVHVNKGERSFMVFFFVQVAINKSTHEKISYDEYEKLSLEDKKGFTLYPSGHVYGVFNIAQTNIREARPDLWEKLIAPYTKPVREEGEAFTFAPLDFMIDNGTWICPITIKEQDSALYRVSEDSILLPTKEQFVDGQAFVTTAFHEMAHSTGKVGVNDRFTEANGWGKDKGFYGREELVAELTAALVSARYGITKHLKDDSASYLKWWLEQLNETPNFLRQVMGDVKKAERVLVERITAAENVPDMPLIKIA